MLGLIGRVCHRLLLYELARIESFDGTIRLCLVCERKLLVGALTDRYRCAAEWPLTDLIVYTGHGVCGRHVRGTIMSGRFGTVYSYRTYGYI